MIWSLLVDHGLIGYVGPGAGLGAIGTVIALVAAILLAVVGFVWYPIKRLRKRIRESNTAKAKQDQESESQ